MAELEGLDALRDAASKATPGHWAVPVANVFRVIAPDQPHTNKPQGMTPPYPWRIIANMGDEDSAAADAHFIALANPTIVLALLDRIAELEG